MRKCKLFRHFDQCCVEWTWSKCRKTAMESKPTQGANTVDEEGYMANSIRHNRVVTGRHGHSVILNRVVTDKPQQVKAIVWCNTRNRFTQQLSTNHMSLKLGMETLHSMDLDWFGNTVKIAKKKHHGA